jgi:hypothetical protein
LKGAGRTLSRGEACLGAETPLMPGEHFRPLLIETRPVSFSCARRVSEPGRGGPDWNSRGRAGLSRSWVTEGSPQALRHRSRPRWVSCRHFILRKRSLLEQLRHVYAADVHLPQSLELDDRQLTHDRLGRGTSNAELRGQTLGVQQLGEALSHAVLRFGS